MSVRSSLLKLLAALPAIVIWTTMNVFITSAVSGLVLIELAAAGYKYIAFGAALLTVVVVYSWLVFNHKLRAYIKSLEAQNK